MPKFHFKQSVLLILLLVSHILAVIAPANANMQKLHNTVQNEDYAPICNGTGKIRWIKLSDYYQTGKITFVELPNPTNDNASNSNNSCPICSLFTQLDDNLALTNAILLFDKAVFSSVSSLTKAYFKQEVASANARAPPLFS